MIAGDSLSVTRPGDHKQQGHVGQRNQYQGAWSEHAAIVYD